MINPQSVFKFELLKVESNAQVSASWTVAADLPYLAGHFPNQPVVPAVAIIDAAVELLRSSALPLAKLEKIKNAKFTSPLLPGQTVQIDAKKIGEHEWTIDFNTKEPSLVARLLLTFT